MIEIIMPSGGQETLWCQGVEFGDTVVINLKLKTVGLCVVLKMTLLLFLQANVMLEYSISEAETLLSKNLNAARKNLAEIEQDLGFLRDQYTTTEVSIL